MAGKGQRKRITEPKKNKEAELMKKKRRIKMKVMDLTKAVAPLEPEEEKVDLT